MPGIVLGMTVEGGGVIREMGRGFSKARKDALKATAEHWHEEMLRPHFQSQNRSRFQHEKRTAFYLEIIKRVKGQGQGRFVDNVLKGQSSRFMQAFFTITGSKDAVTLTMKPPAYFARPFIGSYTDSVTGKQKRITRQPDKPREVTTTDERDRRVLSEFAAKEMATRIAQAQSTRDFKKLF